MAAVEQEQQLLHLSLVLGGRLLDASGTRLGRVEDLAVRLDADGYPPVSGALARVGGNRVFVPAVRIAGIEPGSVRLRGTSLGLRSAGNRPFDALLAREFLGRRVHDLLGGCDVRAHDIELERVNGWYCAVGIDPTARARVRRLLPGRMGRAVSGGGFRDWTMLDGGVHVERGLLARHAS